MTATTGQSKVVEQVPQPVATSRRAGKSGRLAIFLVGLYALLFPIHVPLAGVNFSLGDFLIPLGLVLFHKEVFLVYNRSSLARKLLLGVVVVAAVSLPRAAFIDLRVGGGVHPVLVELVKLSTVFCIGLLVSSLLVNSGERGVRNLVRISQIACWAISIAAAVGWLHSSYGRLRPTGTFPNPNIFANYIVMVWFMALGMLFQSQKGKQTLLWSVAAGLGGIALIKTGSRGGLLSCMVGTALFFSLLAVSKPKKIQRLLIISVVGLAGLTIYISLNSENLFLLQRIENTFRQDTALNIDIRKYYWELARRDFESSPLFGIGYGMFAKYHAQPTHNIYWSYLSELGGLAALALLVILAACMLDVWRSRLWREPVPLSMVCFLCACLVQGITNNVDQWRAVWVGIGIVLAYQVAFSRGGMVATHNNRVKRGVK